MTTDFHYLDNGSTTQLDPQVLEKMMPWLKSQFGNPSSLHPVGRQASMALADSRKRMARLLGVLPEEIVFTGSGTESNNLALKGLAMGQPNKRQEILISAIEHDSIIQTAHWLSKLGFRTRVIPVNTDGLVEAETLHQYLSADTLLVSVMHANNEIGTIQPIEQLAEISHRAGAYFHTDACQSFGKIPIPAQSPDLISINSHKIHGPKGVGALIKKKEVPLMPLFNGGGQEFGLRSSTENIAGIIGFEAASQLMYDSMDEEHRRILALRKDIENWLEEHIPDVYFNGSLEHRLPHNLNFCIAGREGDNMRLLLRLNEKNIAVSSGSACSSNHEDSASHVLKALGRNVFEARGSIRLTFGRYSTAYDCKQFCESLREVLSELKPIFSQ